MEESKHNDLNNLFHSRLNTDGIKSDKWNTPPSSVFENALAIIATRKDKKRRKIWLWIGLILALVFLLSIISYNYFSIRAMNDRIEHHLEKQNQQIEPAAKDTIAYSKLLTDPINILPELNNSEVLTTINKKHRGKTSLSDRSISENSTDDYKLNSLNNIVAQDSPSMISQTDPKSPINNVNNNNNNNNNNTLFGSRSVSILKILPLSNKQLQSDQSILPIVLDMASLKEVNDLHIDHSSSIRGRLFGGLIYSSLDMKNAENINATLSGFENNKTGFSLGLGIDKKLSNRFYAFGDIQYSRINSESIYNEGMQYNKENELIMPNGDLMYQTDYVVQSTMSRYEGTMDIPIASFNNNSETSVTNKTLITQNFDLIQSNLGLGYSLFQYNSWSFDLKAGIGINYILSLNEDMGTQMFFDDRLMHYESAKKQSSHECNQFNTSMIAGARLNYHYDQRLHFNLSFSTDRGLSSLKKGYSSDKNVKTYLNQNMFSLGISVAL